ncbi:MAG: ECF transporter S component [Bacillota bacterium]|nr:ECF transporter S component [Bacillota bacterium]
MKKLNTYHICMIAMAIVVNFIGGQIALHLQLPIYLDSIGTFFVAATCGPILGMIPNTLSGLLMWALGDPFSLYYAPVGILVGLVAGYVWPKKKAGIVGLLVACMIVTLPTSLCSASITAILFGGITSSGSTVIVQVLKPILGLTVACFIVQLITDFIDRIIAMVIVEVLEKRIPASLKNKLKN